MLKQFTVIAFLFFCLFTQPVAANSFLNGKQQEIFQDILAGNSEFSYESYHEFWGHMPITVIQNKKKLHSTFVRLKVMLLPDTLKASFWQTMYLSVLKNKKIETHSYTHMKKMITNLAHELERGHKKENLQSQQFLTLVKDMDHQLTKTIQKLQSGEIDRKKTLHYIQKKSAATYLILKRLQKLISPPAGEQLMSSLFSPIRAL